MLPPSNKPEVEVLCQSETQLKSYKYVQIPLTEAGPVVRLVPMSSVW